MDNTTMSTFPNDHTACADHARYIASDAYNTYLEMVVLQAQVKTVAQQMYMKQQEHEAQLRIIKFKFKNLERRFNNHIKLTWVLVTLGTALALNHLAQIV